MNIETVRDRARRLRFLLNPIARYRLLRRERDDWKRWCLDAEAKLGADHAD